MLPMQKARLIKPKKEKEFGHFDGKSRHSVLNFSFKCFRAPIGVDAIVGEYGAGHFRSLGTVKS